MTSGVEFTGEVRNGHLPSTVRQSISSLLSRMEGKRVAVRVAPYRKRRSLNQNSFFHGPFLLACTEMFNDAGNDMDNEAVKTALKEKFGLRMIVKMPDGKEHSIPKSTRDYTTMEIEDFMTKIRAWAAEYGFVLPLPNEAA